MDRDQRFFVVGLALGALGLLVMFALAGIMGLRTGYKGVPPKANHFTR